MKRLLPFLPLLLLAACDPGQEAEPTEDSPARTVEREARPAADPAARRSPSLRDLERVPRETRVAEFRVMLMAVEDEDLDLALEQVDRIEEAGSRTELLYELADDLEGRAREVRLPMLLAISQHRDADKALRDTLTADLCRELELSYVPDPGELAELVEAELATPGL